MTSPFAMMNDALATARNAVNAASAAAVHAATPVVNDATNAAANAAANVAASLPPNPIPGLGTFPGNMGSNPFGNMGINIPGFGVNFPWGGVVPPPPPPPGVAIQPAGPVAARTPYTQLAQNAMALLRGASKELLSEAMQIVRAKQLAGGDIVNWLERRTKVGEVLGMPAANWSADTVSDFAQAFQMNAGRAPAMDAIVAIGVLNMPELENEIRAENASGATTNDLIQNRRVVAQYPPPGTPLQPPYVVLVAVEHQDTRRADDMVNAILGNLVGWQNYKLPREAAAKLG